MDTAVAGVLFAGKLGSNIIQKVRSQNSESRSDGWNQRAGEKAAVHFTSAFLHAARFFVMSLQVPGPDEFQARARKKYSAPEVNPVQVVLPVLPR